MNWFNIQLQNLENDSRALRKLSIYGALVIIDKQPALNRHVYNFINRHKLFDRSNHNRETFVAVQTRNDIRVDDNLNVNASACRYFIRLRRWKFITYTFQFTDVSKFKIYISLIILTISKNNCLRFIDSVKTPANKS